jgi:hypothetical protein
MEDRDKAIEDLRGKIEDLQRRHRQFHQEIETLQRAIVQLQQNDAPVKAAIVPTPDINVEPKIIAPPPVATPAVTTKPFLPKKKTNSALEDFIGTNLLNKVGIAILVLGIAFGAKYSIDHELINPLTRIILGYVAGIALVIIAIRLKKKHENFSAVLLSGGMAVFYFLTYAAYDFYGLIPQAMTFILMVVFTGFTVFAAIQYDKQVIGIIGLVGAYAVPFLLSDGSGKVIILFSYMSIINIGILTLAFKKYWKSLYYIAFALTWIIFASWFAAQFYVDDHFWLSVIFATVFFLIFYVTFLAYKLVRKESLSRWDVVLMLLNSFIYFAYGYITIDTLSEGDQYLGLFTVFTALIHFIACAIIYKKQQEQFKDIFYLAAGMVLIFLTIAVPVQLEGNYVTLVWAAEAALLFWIGRTKSFPVYEKLSYPLILLCFVSLLHDWDNTYTSFYSYEYDQPAPSKIFLNIQFLSSLLVTAAFVFIVWISRKTAYNSPLKEKTLAHRLFNYGLPLLVLFIVYTGIFKEVETFWGQRYAASKIHLHSSDYGDYNQFDSDIERFKLCWLIIYSAIFAIALSILQMRFIKNQFLLYVSLVINALVIFTFITTGLLELSELRNSYLTQDMAQYYYRDYGHIIIRYISLSFILPLLWINYRYLKNEIFTDQFKQTERILFHVVLLALLSSELVHWLELARIENSFKLALSILWGSYALFLIIVGLLKNVKSIRMAAMILFGVTLIKLFLYDMADMTTIAKTIVMIILGVLLLVSSFLYNKYKQNTASEKDNTNTLSQ